MNSKAVWCALFVCVAGFQQVRAEEASGEWGGILASMARVIVQIDRTPEGRLQAHIESPDRPDGALTSQQVEATSDHLRIVASNGAVYDGKWDRRQHAWVGTWSHGQVLPLVLKRVDAAAIAALVPKCLRHLARDTKML